MFNAESGDLFARVLAGLDALPVEVLATVGPQLDLGVHGAPPANVRLERYVPQAEVLARCDVVVSHGGSGTVVGALAFGVPSVLLPMGADQPENAARCEALGAGIVLDPIRATPEAIGDAVMAVLSDGSYRAAAGRLAAEARSLPSAAHAVAALERLAVSASARRGTPRAARGAATRAGA